MPLQKSALSTLTPSSTLDISLRRLDYTWRKIKSKSFKIGLNRVKSKTFNLSWALQISIVVSFSITPPLSFLLHDSHGNPHHGIFPTIAVPPSMPLQKHLPPLRSLRIGCPTSKL